MKKLVALLAVMPVAALVLQPAIGWSQNPPPSTTHVRFEDNERDSWRRGCRSDTCLHGNIYATEVATPQSDEFVDVVVTVTMDFKTSGGDYGVVSLVPAHPNYRIDSPSSRMKTTTTLVWQMQDVPAAGKALDISLWVKGKDGPDAGGRAGWVKGSKLTVVVDMLAAD